MAETPYIPDPFTSIGGGVYRNGGWIQKSMLPPGEQDQQAVAPAGPSAPTTAAAEPAAASTSPYGPGWTPYGEGGWMPPGMAAPAEASAPSAGPAAPAPSPVAGPSAPASISNTDPFASLGGGTATAYGGWLPPNYPGAPNVAGGGTLNPGQPQATPTAPGATPGAGQPAPGVPLATNSAQIQTPFYSALSGLLQLPQNIDANDPQIKNALNASRAEEERNFAKQRGMLAERAAAEGTSMSGGFDSQLGNLRAGIGARQGTLAANMTREAQQQRMANIMSALQIGQGVMSDSDRNQLQRELADLDAALKREGLDVTRQQTAVGQQESQADQALRKYLADQSTGFNYAQLGQQGTQFGQQLGATLGMHDADLNQALIIALLGGQGGGAA